MPDSSRWPLHPPPYPGEALSSWVGRLAQALDVPPAVLVRNEAGPLYRSSTGYHLDFDPPEHVLHTLAAGTGQPVSAVRRLTARGYMPSLLDAPEDTLTATKWSMAQYTQGLALLLPSDGHRGRHQEQHRGVLPWYCLQRFRQPHGCPDCLAETPEPYLRLHWRFAWMVTCPVHQRLLQPFVIRRPAAGPPQTVWNYKETHMPAMSSALLMLDALTLQAVTDGRCDLPFATIPAGLWVRLLRAVLDELGVGVRHAGACGDRLKELWASVGRGYGHYLEEWRPYERLYPKYQQMFMAMAAQALSDAFVQPGTRQRILAMARPRPAEPHSSVPDAGHCPLSVSHN